MHTDSYQTILKEAGFRVTSGRVAVLDVLATSPAPLSTKDIVKKVPSTAKVDQATVYRMLTALREKGIVQLVNMEHDHAHWELAGHHHHVICEQCGLVTELEACDIDALQKAAKRISGFPTIARHSLEFFGTCASCTKNSR
ncbi:MAG: transcriptional repressor [Candidatus Doudnabacteria bacterium]|nr:transcriptional repressor [Candidatus Doudnabacteria bacterium]